MNRRPPRSTPFPYTTLFRSSRAESVSALPMTSASRTPASTTSLRTVQPSFTTGAEREGSSGRAPSARHRGDRPRPVVVGRLVVAERHAEQPDAEDEEQTGQNVDEGRPLDQGLLGVAEVGDVVPHPPLDVGGGDRGVVGDRV